MKVLLSVPGVIVLFILLFLCSPAKYESPRYVKLAHEITNKTAKKIEKEKGVVLVGIGGRMMHDIQLMRMSFDLYREIDLEEAREIVLFSAEEYLNNINGNQEIRQYLHEDPFTVKNIEIKLFIYNPNRSSLPPEKMYYVSLSEETLSYYAKFPDRAKPIYKETYEEALNIVNSQKTKDSTAVSGK